METEAKLPLQHIHGWNTNSSSLGVILCVDFYFFDWARSTRSQWIFILFSPALISLSFLSGLLMVFWAPWKLPFCFAVFKFLFQISRQAWVIDIRLPKLLYCKRKPSLKTEHFFIVTSATWACEDLHRLKRNRLGCASTFAMKSHAPFCGVMNLALALWQQMYFWMLTLASNGLSTCQTCLHPSADRIFFEMDAIVSVILKSVLGI